MEINSTNSTNSTNKHIDYTQMPVVMERWNIIWILVFNYKTVSINNTNKSAESLIVLKNIRTFMVNTKQIVSAEL